MAVWLYKTEAGLPEFQLFPYRIYYITLSKFFAVTNQKNKQHNPDVLPCYALPLSVSDSRFRPFRQFHAILFLKLFIVFSEKSPQLASREEEQDACSCSHAPPRGKSSCFRLSDRQSANPEGLTLQYAVCHRQFRRI